MANRNAGPTRITVLYDPLCGWCYGATPAIRRLEQGSGAPLELVPTGLGNLGLQGSAARLLGADSELVLAVEKRIGEARRALRPLGARGVPTVVAGGSPAWRLIPSELLYGRFDDLLHHVKAA
jgi:protein-disulfide isomerase-like protein with CxxC motif